MPTRREIIAHLFTWLRIHVEFKFSGSLHGEFLRRYRRRALTRKYNELLAKSSLTDEEQGKIDQLNDIREADTTSEENVKASKFLDAKMRWAAKNLPPEARCELLARFKQCRAREKQLEREAITRLFSKAITKQRPCKSCKRRETCEPSKKSEKKRECKEFIYDKFAVIQNSDEFIKHIERSRPGSEQSPKDRHR